MRTEIDLEESFGKTLERVTFSSRHCVLLFDAGTFTTLEATYNTWGEYSEISTTRLIPDSFWDFGRTELIQSGICTAEEYDAKRAAYEAELKTKMAERQEQRERQELERLKAKYEGGKP